MSESAALAVVPDPVDESAPGTETNPLSARQQISLARGLRDAAAAERDRIEAALMPHRRRSVEHYTDLAMRLGLRELAKVAPVIDPLADLGL